MVTGGISVGERPFPSFTLRRKQFICKLGTNRSALWGKKSWRKVYHENILPSYLMCLKNKTKLILVKERVCSVVAYFRKIPVILVVASLSTLISLSTLLSLKLPYGFTIYHY